MPLQSHLSHLNLTAHLSLSPLTLTPQTHRDSDSLNPGRTLNLPLTLKLTLTPTLTPTPKLTRTLTTILEAATMIVC